VSCSVDLKPGQPKRKKETFQLMRLIKKAMAVCSLNNDDPVTMVNVTTQYDLLPPTIGNGQQSKLLTLDPINKASLWWGASLM
jgi:hypothetical protein